MKLISLSLLSLLGSASALPQASSSSSSPSASPSPKPASQQAFTVVAARSGSPIHFLPLTASSGHFFLGGKSSTYCPDVVRNQGACPPGEVTAIVADHYLDAEVPGGQEIYVDPKGALAFTVPHSAYIPDGSSREGFKYTSGSSNPNGLGSWTFGDGFVACNSGNATVPRWQVHAFQKDNADQKGCLGFDAMTVEKKDQSAPAAWEYL